MAHVACHFSALSLAGVIKVMTFGLAGDGAVDCLHQRPVILGVIAQMAAQVSLVLLPQTHEELTRAG